VLALFQAAVRNVLLARVTGMHSIVMRFTPHLPAYE
jgi:hypothetical protein